MNADENKMLIGVYLRSSAAHKRPFHSFLRSQQRSGIVNPFGAYDKSGGGGTDVVERITGDQGKDLIFGGSQHSDIVGPHDAGRDDAITELAEQGGEGNHVVAADVSQWPEKRVAVPGNADVSLLSRKCRTGDMADRPAEGGGANPLDDDDRKAETWNVEAADQAGGWGRQQPGRPRSGGRVLGCRAGPPAGPEQPIEAAVLGLLENPGVQHNVGAPGDQREADDKEQALGPEHHTPQRLFGNHQPHLPATSLNGRDVSAAM